MANAGSLTPQQRQRLTLLAWPALVWAASACAPRQPLPMVDPALTYTLLDGQRQQLGALRGQAVLVNFWATTCTICVAEMPQLVALHQRLAPRGLRTLAVAMHYDPPAFVADYAARQKLPFAVVIDNQRAVEKAFGGVVGTPTTFVLDRSGQVVQRIVGEPDFATLESQLQALLA